MSSQALYTNKAPDLGSGEGIDAFAPGHAAPPYLLADPHPGAKKPITLALQGGGAWGAYTWGVLDALLASRQVTIDQISGTSAGAINGAIVVSALAGGPAGASLRSGRAAARAALASFWRSVATTSAAPLLWEPWSQSFTASVNHWVQASGLLSPYSAGPFATNPLRDAIAAHVDIEAIRSARAADLFVTVTHVKTGLPRVMSNADMSVDALAASACLPQLFQAVEIDGEPYWDGGYSGNPTLWPLLRNRPNSDVVLVQLAPEYCGDLPRDAQAIKRRVGEIVFNSSLVAEMQAIAAIREAAVGCGAPSPFLSARMHRIGPPSSELFDQGTAPTTVRGIGSPTCATRAGLPHNVF